MPLYIQKSWWTKEQVQANRDKIYVFGDNFEREGNGGQAKACRHEPNTIGIRTKQDRYRNEESYLYDQLFARNCYYANQDFMKVIFALHRGETVIFPADGFGTGLANLAINAPMTLDYINKMTAFIIETFNGEYID